MDHSNTGCDWFSDVIKTDGVLVARPHKGPFRLFSD